MAEINIERKQRSVLPWLLAGLLVLGLLWFLFARNSGSDMAAGRTDSAYRDTSAAAGTLAPADSMGGTRVDTTGAGGAATVPPPR